MNVREICNHLGVSQKELAKKIGLSESGLNNSISTSKISKQTKASIELVVENFELKKELEKYKALRKNILDAFDNPNFMQGKENEPNTIQ